MSSVYAHLDRSAYWRARADLAKAKSERTQDEAVDLRRELASLKKKLDDRPSSPVKKRKKPDTDVILVPRSPKRTKRAASPDGGGPTTFDHPTDAEFSQAGEFGESLFAILCQYTSSLTHPGDILLRSVFHILTAFRTTQRTRPIELAYHIERASSTIPQIVQNEVHKIVAELATDNEQLKSALTITTRAIATVFAGYTRLMHAHSASEGAAVQGRVIYAVVSMFRSLLCDFQSLSAEEIDRAALVHENVASARPAVAPTSSAQTPSARPSTAQLPSARPSTAQTPVARPSTARMTSPEKSENIGMPNARPSTAQINPPKKARGKVIGMKGPSTAPTFLPAKSKGIGKGRARPVDDQKVKENPTLSLYATFLGNLVDMLDPKLEANRPLFEGFTYCILDLLGKRMYSIIFGHSRAPDLEAEIKQDVDIDPNQSELPTTTIRPPQPEDDERKQIKLEAPYLLHLLNRIMITAPAHFGKVKSSKAKNNKAPSKNTLALSAKECLQRTLVNAIFGTEGGNDDDLFKDCLKMPTPGEGTPTMPKVKEIDVLEHFKEEVWRCLGWDILAKDAEW